MQHSMSELDDMLQQVEKQMSELEKQLQRKDLSESERAGLQKKLDELAKLKSNIELSKKARDFLDKLMSMPEYKQLMDMMAKLQKDAKQGQQGNNELTDEQIKEMIKKLEELADQLNSDEKMREYLKQLMEALKNCKGACNNPCMGLGLKLSMCMGMGNGGRSKDNYYANTGVVPQSDKEKTINSKQDFMSVTGQRQENGEETYVEVRGPASLGQRSKTPYSKVLPQYKRAAEQAMDKNKIPKAYQKRVREYFESLEGGR